VRHRNSLQPGKIAGIPGCGSPRDAKALAPSGNFQQMPRPQVYPEQGNLPGKTGTVVADNTELSAMRVDARELRRLGSLRCAAGLDTVCSRARAHARLIA